MDGERFNELKISRFDDPKPDRGFKTLYAGSQVPQYSAFFGFDFAGGGLGYFDVKVIEVRDLIEGVCNARDCYPNFEFGLANQRIIDAIERSLETKGWVRLPGPDRQDRRPRFGSRRLARCECSEVPARPRGFGSDESVCATSRPLEGR